MVPDLGPRIPLKGGSTKYLSVMVMVLPSYGQFECAEIGPISFDFELKCFTPFYGQN